MRFIDSHAHINFPQFAGEVDSILDNAASSGLVGLINVGTDLETSRQSIELAEQYPHVFATVGLHPHDSDAKAESFHEIEKLATHPRVIAIGEIGLDFFRNFATVEIQTAAFIRQLKLAIATEKPIILHCRDAYDEMLKILLSEYLPQLSGRQPGILHSFAANPHVAQKFVDHGFLLGINNLATYPQNEAIRETIRLMPTSALVLETDCPFLPPQSLRGKRSEPAHVIPVAELVAELKGLSLKEVGDITTHNLEGLFGSLWK